MAPEARNKFGGPMFEFLGLLVTDVLYGKEYLRHC